MIEGRFSKWTLGRLCDFIRTFGIEITCDRASLLCTRSLDVTIASMVKRTLGERQHDVAGAEPGVGTAIDERGIQQPAELCGRTGEAVGADTSDHIELAVQRDDGNAVGSDGCSATCTVEPGYGCEAVQGELPVWVTAAGNPETFRMAGANGFAILTHLLFAFPSGRLRSAWDRRFESMARAGQIGRQ